jgi:hypothetical protein
MATLMLSVMGAVAEFVHQGRDHQLTRTTGEDPGARNRPRLLHEKYDNRPLAEMEAESTAYVVCQALGLDTSDYSFGYVATWAGGGEQAIAGIKGSCERIQKSASTILRAFEPAPEESEVAA